MASKSTSLPPTPIPLSARSIMRDPSNSLGDRYNPLARYSLLNKRHDASLLTERLAEGWEVVLDDVPGDGNADSFMLLSKVE